MNGYVTVRIAIGNQTEEVLLPVNIPDPVDHELVELVTDLMEAADLVLDTQIYANLNMLDEALKNLKVHLGIED